MVAHLLESGLVVQLCGVQDVMEQGHEVSGLVCSGLTPDHLQG